MRQLPYLNFRVPVGETDLKFTNETISYEIQQRTKILSEYGIVSEVNTINSSSPLMVSLNEEDSKVVIGSGGAVTSDGNIVYSYAEVQLDLEVSDDWYTVFIEYDTIGVDSTLSRYNKYEPKYFERLEKAIELINSTQSDIDTIKCGSSGEPTVIKIDKSSNLTDQKTYTRDRLNNIVKLALVQRTVTTTTLIIEGSDIRPWFSPKDIVHRSKVGSGAITDNNPHGLGISDFTVGPLTLFDIVQNNGKVISNDVDFPTIPGKKVTLTITSSASSIFTINFMTDADNGNTNISNTRPYSINKITNVGGTVEYAFTYDKNLGTLTVFEADGSSLKIVAFIADAGTPFASSSNSIKIIHPNENEVIITEGLAINTIEDDEVFLSGSVVERDFRCYVNSDKQLISNPGVLGTYAILNPSYYQTDTVLNSDEIGKSKIQLGINTNDIISSKFIVKIKGILATTGAEVEESLDIANKVTINTTDYLITSTNVYTSLTSFSLEADTTGAYVVPTDARMTIYNFRTYESRRRMAAICDVNHKESGIVSFKDKRIAVPSIQQVEQSFIPPSRAIASTYDSGLLMASENYNLLKLVDPELEEFDSGLNCDYYSSRMIRFRQTTLSNFTTYMLRVVIKIANDIPESELPEDFLKPATVYLYSAVGSLISTSTAIYYYNTDIGELRITFSGVTALYGCKFNFSSNFIHYSVYLSEAATPP